jgi:metal-responsive CopG/Arc/MetJ family transcriptional regulator
MISASHNDATGLLNDLVKKHQEVDMRTTITIPDTLFQELMSFTEAGSRTEAVRVAVETYVRRAKLEQLRALRGKLDIIGTEKMDEADIREQHEQFDR